MSSFSIIRSAPPVPGPPVSTNLVGYYDANRQVQYADRETVGELCDFSGSGVHALQATESKKPIFQRYGFDRRAAMYFDGVDDVLPVDIVNQILTIFVVGALDPSFAAGSSLQWISGADDWDRATISDLDTASFHNWKLGATSTGAAGVDSNPHFFCYRINPSANVADVYHDGKLDLDAASGNLVGGALHAFGARKHPSGRHMNFLCGLVSEIIVYTRELIDAERYETELYLSRKYDLPFAV